MSIGSYSYLIFKGDDDELSEKDGKFSKPGGERYSGSKVKRGKCDVRLTAQEDLELSRLAEKNGVTRSEIVRKALRDFIMFNSSEV